MNVGFIGCGGNAMGHMKRVHAMESVRIQAVCDVSEERSRAAAVEVDAEPFTDVRWMLDAKTLDACYISIPPFAHGEAELELCRRGIPFLVEKPVVLHLEVGLKILEAVEKAGIITAVGYQTRYTDLANRARSFLADRTIVMIASHRWGGLPSTPWWRVMEQSGGQLVEQTTHQIDLMRYLAGDIAEVFAHYDRRVMKGEDFTIPDIQSVSFRFASGALGYSSSSCLMTRGGGQSTMEVLLEGLRLSWSRDHIQTFPEQDPELGEPAKPTRSIDEHFIEAVQKKDPSLIRSNYRDGLMTADVTLAANESARTGRPVAPYFATSR